MIDLLKHENEWFSWSSRRLMEATNEGPVIINPVVYAEAAAGFEVEQDLASVLEDAGLELEPLPFPAAFIAGHTHYAYRKQGGPKQKTLPDFLIGAHAMHKGYRLLTRDVRLYRSYFPALDIIAPDTHP
ncbi:MAG: type II toxin-antitoxin system VapC family toxin [Aestuariivirga sp.]